MGKANVKVSSGRKGYYDGKHLRIEDAKYMYYDFNGKGTKTHGPMFTFLDLTDGQKYDVFLTMNPWAVNNSQPSPDGAYLDVSDSIADRFSIKNDCEYGCFLGGYRDCGGNDDVPGDNIKSFIGTEFIAGYVQIKYTNKAGEEVVKWYLSPVELKGNGSKPVSKPSLNLDAINRIKATIGTGSVNKGVLLSKLMSDVEAREMLVSDAKLKAAAEEGHWQFNGDTLTV